MTEAKIIVEANSPNGQAIQQQDISIFAEVEGKRARINNCHYLKFEIDAQAKHPPSLIMHVYPDEISIQGKTNLEQVTPPPDPQQDAHRKHTRQLHNLKTEVQALRQAIQNKHKYNQIAAELEGKLGMWDGKEAQEALSKIIQRLREH